MPRRVLFVIRGKLGATLVAYATVRRHADAEFCFFPPPEDLLRGFADLACSYCTETGLRRLTASMEGPAPVFFGPKQPRRFLIPGLPAARGIRLAVLDREHREEKLCETLLRIEALACSFGAEPPIAALAGKPVDCPRCAYPIDRLAEIA